MLTTFTAFYVFGGPHVSYIYTSLPVVLNGGDIAWPSPRLLYLAICISL